MKSDELELASLTNDVAIFRRFNRTYTRFIGTLNEGLFDSEYSLVEARILYEIATRAGSTAKAIAQELGIDPGYLSRILGGFERSHLLKRKASCRDGRYSELTLTLRGRSAFKKLNSLSERQAHTVLDGLPPPVRVELIHCMQTMEGIFNGSGQNRSAYVLRPHRIGDMGWVVYSESVGYAQQFGWDEAFEALVARIVEGFITNFDSSCERCWIAEADGQNVGHIFLVKNPDEPGTAKLRLLFVEPSARGMGLGEALVQECIRFARTSGYRKIGLWTQSCLLAAHRIYEKSGFHLIKEDPHHSFGKDLVAQGWELELT
jgi:DNA-binding MarR family transcriptional regulator/GNAT superfamily N-acetyltransferase